MLGLTGGLHNSARCLPREATVLDAFRGYQHVLVPLDKVNPEFISFCGFNNNSLSTSTSLSASFQTLSFFVHLFLVLVSLGSIQTLHYLLLKELRQNGVCDISVRLVQRASVSSKDKVTFSLCNSQCGCQSWGSKSLSQRLYQEESLGMQSQTRRLALLSQSRCHTEISLDLTDKSGRKTRMKHDRSPCTAVTTHEITPCKCIMSSCLK